MDVMDLISTLGTVLDTPGAMVRTGLAGENPLSAVFDTDKRVSGRQLLERYGLAGKNEDQGWVPDAGDLGGFVAEMVLDPTNLIGGGLLSRLMGKAGKAKAANAAARELLETAPHKFLPEGFHSTSMGRSGAIPGLKNGSYLDEPLDVPHVIPESESRNMNAAISQILSERLGQPNQSSLSEAQYFYTPNGRSIRVADHPRYYHFEDSGVDLYDDVKRSNYDPTPGSRHRKFVPNPDAQQNRRAGLKEGVDYYMPNPNYEEPLYVNPSDVADAAIAANNKLPPLDLPSAIQRWESLQNKQQYGRELYEYVSDLSPVLTKENQHADLVDLLRSAGLKHPKGFRGKREYASDYLTDQYRKIHGEPSDAPLRAIDEIIGIQSVPSVSPLLAALLGHNALARPEWEAN